GGADTDTAFNLHLRVLSDEQATRQNIIDGFQQHLAQAGAEDVALFYYAGHGARAKAPEEFWPVTPDRMLETIVCYDSRIDSDHWDLADKELAQLIAEVDQKQPHIVVILDCCHSGSGTREGHPTVATRRAEPDLRDRPLTSFIVSPADAAAALSPTASAGSGETTRSAIATPTAMKLPIGRHIVLSACSNLEEAKEYHGAGQPRGTFSYFLQESLTKANGSLSYRDLFKRTNALVRSGVSAQSPQMEATHPDDLQQPFLGGAIATSPPYFTVSHHREHGWVIDGGAIHGLQSPITSQIIRAQATDAPQTTTLALYPFGASPEQLKDPAASVAIAEITEVLPQLSKIESDGLSDTVETFKAVVIASPLPPLQVFLTGENAGVESLRRAIATIGPSTQSSLYIQAIDQIDGADFRAIAQDGEYFITSPTDDRPLVSPVQGYDLEHAAKVAQNLEHIARWQTIAKLASPASSQIQGSVELKIYTGVQPHTENATEITDSQIRLSYPFDSATQTWSAPRFRIKLHNTSSQTLYCALFYLTERFKVDVLKPDGVTSLVQLRPNQEIWFANGGALMGTVPDDLWQAGITECQDLLKLIACTDEFDANLMVLEALGSPAVTRPVTRSGSPATAGGSLNQLMQRVNTRDISFASAAPRYDDWVANQITFTFVRPQQSVPLNATESIAVSDRLQIQPHAELQANIRLTTVPQSTRALGSVVLPPLLQTETEPFQFTQSRASDPGLSVLELSNVSQLEAVTPEQPLRIETDIPLAEGEYLLPVAYDGEFYLPLGYGKTKAGKTQIVIERLTEPISEGNRSVQGSIRIFFQKVVVKKIGAQLAQHLGVAFEYPLLAIAQLKETISGSGTETVAESGAEVVYLRDLDDIKRKISQANTIALYIHGIFGDTESMLPSLKTTIAALENDAQPIGQLYDLVLAFDYENLNTTIDQNARLLKERLEAVGLGTNHNKTLHIIAHSMGGLVARWFVEQEGGNQVVSHVIMLGTPNAGSPWPQVQAGVTAAVSFAINGLSLIAAPLKILDGLLKRIEDIDVSLDQMQPGSEFLAEMAKAKDPGIPYTLVIGNTALIAQDETASLRQRLMNKLGKLAELPFFKQPNDIAVLVESITALPAGRSPAPKQLPTACNHLEYFTHPAGLASLTEAVVGTGIATARLTAQTHSTASPNESTPQSTSVKQEVLEADPEDPEEAQSPAVAASETESLETAPLETDSLETTPSKTNSLSKVKPLLTLLLWVLVAIALGGLFGLAVRQLLLVPQEPPAVEPSTLPRMEPPAESES
ncbi:MAG: caspase family protein, partial [Phormidesmis sp.]